MIMLLRSLIFIFAIVFASSFYSLVAMANLRLKMAQLHVRPGDFNFILSQVQIHYQNAVLNDVDLLVFPEGVLPGYPSNDILNEKDYIDRAEVAFQNVRMMTTGKKTAIAIGHIGRNPRRTGRALQNFLSVVADGKVIHRQAKVLLPTYGPLDDARYFEPGTIAQIKNVSLNGKNVSILICEDAWAFIEDQEGRRLYKHNPVLKVKRNKPDLVIAVSASPFERGKQALREEVYKDVSRRTGAPVLYLNQVGSVDGLGFDGSSFVVDAGGTIGLRMASFQSDSITLDMTDSKFSPVSELPFVSRPKFSIKNENALVVDAIVHGIQQYTQQIGLKAAVFGLSGGIDSAMTAFFAVQALGPNNVFVIKMPSAHSTESSISDADQVIRNLKIPEQNVITIPIQEIVTGFGHALANAGIDLEGLAQSDSTLPYETIQARTRMILEFFISTLGGNLEHSFFKKMMRENSKWRHLLTVPKFKLQTSNKSELATGNGAIFADMAGFLAPLADIYKTELWELAKYINTTSTGELIPESIIAKEPSAELLSRQFSIDRFPSYRVIDPILRELIAGQMNQQQLTEKFRHLDLEVPPQFRPIVGFVSKLFFQSEFKRQLSQAPIIRVSSTALGKDFRKPITIKRLAPVPSLSCLDLFFSR